MTLVVFMMIKWFAHNPALVQIELDPPTEMKLNLLTTPFMLTKASAAVECSVILSPFHFAPSYRYTLSLIHI